MAQFALAPGRSASRLARQGERLTEASLERAISSHMEALSWVEDGRLRVELGSILAIQALQGYSDDPVTDLAGAEENLVKGLGREPVQPLGWLELAAVTFEDGRLAETAQALDLAARLQPYEPENARVRAALGLAVWDALAPHTRDAVRWDLRVLAEEDPSSFSGLMDRVGDPDLVWSLVRDEPVLRELAFAEATRSAFDPPGAQSAPPSSAGREGERRQPSAAGRVADAGDASAAAPISLDVKSYWEVRQGRSAELGEGAIFAYLWGVWDALNRANEVLSEAGVSPLFCIPPGGQPDLETFQRWIDEVIDERQRSDPEFDSLAAATPLGMVALQVLDDHFPCPEQ